MGIFGNILWNIVSPTKHCYVFEKRYAIDTQYVVFKTNFCNLNFRNSLSLGHVTKETLFLKNQVPPPTPIRAFLI